MFSISRYDRHVRLISRMARALGFDLAEAVSSGRMSPEGYRERVMRCSNCKDADACERLLDASEDGLDAAPAYCRNRDDFDALAR